MSTIAIRMDGLNRFAIELRQQDVSNGARYAVRRALKHVGESHKCGAIAQSNCRVYAGKRIEADVEQRHGSARSQASIFLEKDILQAQSRRCSLQFKFQHGEKRWGRCVQSEVPFCR